jgi:hypothetical protein
VISQSNISKSLEKSLQNKEDTLFPQSEIQILFLNNGVEKSVQAYETNSLPCSEIIEHLNRGESIFISKKKVQNKPELKIVFDNPDTSLYLNRV